MAKKKAKLKDIDEIKQELIDDMEEAIDELSTVDTEPEPDKQRCSDCAYFEVYGGTYRKRGYRTCTAMYKNHNILAFGKYGKLAPSLVSDSLVPEVFSSCKYFKNKLDK